MGKVCNFKDVMDATSEYRPKMSLYLCENTVVIHSKLCLLEIQLTVDIFYVMQISIGTENGLNSTSR